MGKKTSSVQADAAVFSQLQEENAALKQENEKLRRKLERMNELLLNAQRARFGQSSEKRDYVIPNQLGIRPFAVGRKNWLFSDTAKGAQSSAIVYTLVETAKANGLDPHAYLLRLLKELPYWGRNLSQDNLDRFLPWQPAVQAACASSTSSKPSGDL